MNFDNFRKDDKTIDAVVRNFEIIGEAANRIPEKVKNGIQEYRMAQYTSLFSTFFLDKKVGQKSQGRHNRTAYAALPTHNNSHSISNYYFTKFVNHDSFGYCRRRYCASYNFNLYIGMKDATRHWAILLFLKIRDNHSLSILLERCRERTKTAVEPLRLLDLFVSFYIKAKTR